MFPEALLQEDKALLMDTAIFSAQGKSLLIL